MNLLGIKVKHKMLGEGIVTEADGNNLLIKFNIRSAKFSFPLAFETFLQAVDNNVQKEIDEQISLFKQKEAAKKADDALKKAEEEKSIIVPISKATSNIKRTIIDGFRPDYNVQHLAKQPILTYKQVEDQFGIRISGFGRGINRTPSSIVLISSIDKKKTGFVYHDHWTTDGDYIYSGEGKNGNQTLTAGNKAIVDADRDGKTIHLFVKFSPQEYYYQGIFKLVDYNLESDVDESGNSRKEYKFRLRKAR